MTPSPAARPPRRIRVLAAAAAVCAVALLASSCSTRPSDTAFTGPTVFSPRSPSPVAASSSPEYQTDVPTASPDLYKQALDVYNIYFAQDAAVQQDAGADPLPPELTAVLTGDALTKETKLYQQTKKAGLYWDRTPWFESVKVTQLMTYVPVGTVIALQACEVTSHARLMSADGTPLTDGEPYMTVMRYYMRYNAQHNLVIYDLNGGGERIQTCPF